MNSTIQTLMQRKSVRAYLNRPVAPSERETILCAAMRAPTAGNLMLYSIIEIEHQNLKDRLAVTCDDQPFIASAPFVLLFAADYQRWFDYYIQSGVPEMCEKRGEAMRLPGEGDLMLACVDTVIAAQTAVIAAESLGIGSCYIGDILEHYEEHRQLFNLPRYVLPVALVCFGYPTEAQQARPQTPRFEEKFILHRDRYHHLDGDELEAMMQERSQRFAATVKAPAGVANMGQFTYHRKFGADFSREMNRSVRAMLEAWTEQKLD